MQEKIIELNDNIDLVVFYGVNNSHLQMIRSLYPALKVTARDNIIRISGNHEDVIKLKDDLMLIQNHILKHHFIADEDILNVIKGKKETVEEALKLLITLKNQASIRNFRGKLFWDGDLEKMRLDK